MICDLVVSVKFWPSLMTGRPLISNSVFITSYPHPPPKRRCTSDAYFFALLAVNGPIPAALIKEEHCYETCY